MSVKLDPRLLTIAEMVRTDGKICDIGTDHALLPCYLYEKGARDIIAADVNDGPLKSAASTIALYGAEECIQVVKSDGLRSVPPCDDVIVAGMGGELIGRIVSECSFITDNTHFILQPMTKAHLLRRELYKNGFEITEERTAESSGKVYTVMLVKYSGHKTEISDDFAFFGKNTDELYEKSVNEKLEKLSRGDIYFKTLIRKRGNDNDCT